MNSRKSQILLTVIRVIAFFIIGYGLVNTGIIIAAWTIYAATNTGIFFKFGLTLPAGIFTSFNAFCIIVITHLLERQWVQEQ